MDTLVTQAAPVKPNGAQAIDLASMPLDDVVAWTVAAAEEKAHVDSVLANYISAGKSEIERRLKESGGKTYAHPACEKIEIEDQFAAYTYDLDALRQAAEWLRTRGKDTDAAKILKHVPEAVTVVPAHDEPGSPVSINALIRNHGENSELGKLLRQAMQRVKTGERLVFQLAKGAR